VTVAYAGIGLTPPPDAQSRVYAYWHGHRIEEFDHPGHHLRWLNHLPIPAPPVREPPRIGALTWPTGASRWATCHLVATGAELDDVVATIGSTLAAKTLEFSDGIRSVSTEMWLLPPRPVQQRGSGDLYLLTLVDDRWWWWLQGNEGLAVAPGTWDGLLTSLFSKVGVGSPTIPAIPVEYGSPTAIRWEVGYKPVPLLLDAAAACVGLRVVRRLDGSVVVQNYEDADADEEAAWAAFEEAVLAGGRVDFDEIGKRLPDRVTTTFWGYDPKLEGVLLADLALPAYAGLTPVAGRAAQVVADMPAVALPADREAYATRAATDYYGWAFSRSDHTLRGFHDRDPNGNDAFVEWVHRPDQLVTRVVRGPLSDLNVYGDKPPTIRFPAEITSSFSSSSGYSWVRLTEYLGDAPEVFESPDGPKSGADLFEVNDNRDLLPGCRVIVYSNPDGPGWACQIDTMRRTVCVGGRLVYQESRDGGTTWVTVEDTGLPCGSGSGGSGSAAEVNPCQNCFPTEGDGDDPEIQVGSVCANGTLYVIYAKIGIISDPDTGTVRNTLYDYTWDEAGCCDCPSGSDAAPGSGGCAGPGCDTYTVEGHSLTLRRDCEKTTEGYASEWRDDQDVYTLQYTLLESGDVAWLLIGPDGCRWTGPEDWSGAGSAEFTRHPDPQYADCAATKTVSCGGGGGGIVVGCDGSPVASTLHVTVTPDGCDPVEFDITYNPGESQWEGSVPLPCPCVEFPDEHWTFHLQCSGGAWLSSFSSPTGDSDPNPATPTVVSAAPLHLQWTGTLTCATDPPVDATIDIEQ
jgi:hypothetical protein